MKSFPSDYLAKPFSVSELLARARAVLRRTQFTAGEQVPIRQSPLILGALSIDYERRLVTMAGREVVLTPTEYRLLCYLAHHAGQAVSQERILAHVWGNEYVRERHLLQVNISRLRRKLETDSAFPCYLLSKPGVGYALVMP
jgi:DNA-binding response OmpR family regulator